MPPRAGRRPGPSFLPTHQLIADLAPLIRDAAHGNAPQNNPAFADEWYADNPLPENEANSAARIERCRTAVSAAMLNHVVTGNYNIYEGGQHRASQSTARRLPQRVLQYCHPLCLDVLRFYRNAYTGKSDIFIFEIQRARGNAKVSRNPVDNTKLDAILRCFYTDEEIHLIGCSKLGSSTQESGTWSWHISLSGRSFLLAFQLHLSNWLVGLLSAVRRLNELDGNSRIVEALNQVQIEQSNLPNDQEETLSYDFDITDTTWINNNIWNEVATLTLNAGRKIVDFNLLHVNESAVRMLKPPRGSLRALLRVENQLTNCDIWKGLASVTDIGKQWISGVLKIMFKIFTYTDSMTLDAAYKDHWEQELFKPLEKFFERMLSAITNADDELPVRLTMQPAYDFHALYLGGLYDFESRKRSIYALETAEQEQEERRAQGQRAQHIIPSGVPAANSTQPTAVEQERTNTTASNQNENPAATNICPTCEQSWPPSMDWPPPQLKKFMGKRIRIDDDPENNSGQSVARNTRSNVAADTSGNVPTSTPVTELTELDRLSNAPNRTFNMRREALNDLIKEVFSRTADEDRLYNALMDMIQLETENRIRQIDRRNAENEERERQRQEQVEQRRLKRERDERLQRQKDEQREARKKQLEEQAQRKRRLEEEALTTPTNADPTNILSATIAKELINQNRNAPPNPPANPAPPPVPVPRPVPHIVDPNPPSPPSAVPREDIPAVHHWIPTKWGETRIADFAIIEQFLEECARIKFFSRTTNTIEDQWIKAFSAVREMDNRYVDNMPTVFNTMEDYVNLWRAVLFNDIFQDVMEILNRDEHWSHTEPPHNFVNIRPGRMFVENALPMGHAYTLDPNYEFDDIKSVNMNLLQGLPQNVRRNMNNLPLRLYDMVLIRGYSCSSGGNIHHWSYLGVVYHRSMVQHPQHPQINCALYQFIVLARCPVAGPRSASTTTRNRAVNYYSCEVVGYVGNIRRALDGLTQIRAANSVSMNLFFIGRTGNALNGAEFSAREPYFEGGMINTDRENRELSQNRQVLSNDLEVLFGEFNRTEQFYIGEFFRLSVADDNGDEQSSRAILAAMDRHFPGLNRSQAYASCLAAKTVNNNRENSETRRKVAAIVGPAGTGKTRTLIHSLGLMANRSPERRITQLEIEQRRRNFCANRGNRQSIVNLQNTANMDQVRVLILTPTHNALDVIEKRIQEGIPVYDATANRWVNVVLPYRRVGYRRLGGQSSALQQVVQDSRTELFPRGFTEEYSAGITLSTLASSYLAFPEDINNYRGRQRLRNWSRYSAIYIDEGSQVADSDTFLLWGNIIQSYGEERNWPYVIFFADPMQKGAVVKGPRSVFKYVKQLSMVEKLLPESTPALTGRNNIRTVMLNKQYRMNHSISILANAITLRDVETAPRLMRQWNGQEEGNDAFYFNGNIDQLPGHLVRRPVIWIDPYVVRENEDTGIQRELVNMLGQGDNESSILEVQAIVHYIGSLRRHTNVTAEDILILTSYNRQRDFIIQALSHYFDGFYNVNNDETYVQRRVLTVSSAEGNEARIVIYSPGRYEVANIGRANEVGLHGLLNDTRELHVLTTRAIDQIVYLGNFDFFRDNLPIWAPVIRTFDNPELTDSEETVSDHD